MTEPKIEAKSTRSLRSRDSVTFETLRTRLKVGYGGKSVVVDRAAQAALEDAGRAVANSRGKATVTVTFELKSTSNGVISTTGKVTAKLPERPSIPVEIYHDRRGNLLEDDPEQLKLGEMEPVGGKSGSDEEEEE